MGQDTDMGDALMSDRKKVVPWPDYAGNPIHEGDTIIHPSGEFGTVLYWAEHPDVGDQWRVDYGDGVDRLCLQIGERGRAVVRQPATTKGNED